MSYKNKYLKYKLKYLNLKKKFRGGIEETQPVVNQIVTAKSPPNIPGENSYHPEVLEVLNLSSHNANAPLGFQSGELPEVEEQSMYERVIQDFSNFFELGLLENMQDPPPPQ